MDQPRTTGSAGFNCQQHPGTRAGWRCLGCQRRLCPDCAAPVTAHRHSQLVLCTHCGATGEVLTRPRAEGTPFLQRLLHAPGYPLRGSGWVSMVAVGAFLTLCDLMSWGFAGPYIAVLEMGALWSYVFFIIRSAGDGAQKLGTPDFRSFDDSIRRPFMQGLLGTSFLWVPVLIYALFFADGLTAKSALTDPVLWAIALFGIFYAPMALVAAATDIGVLGMLNPLQIIGYITRIGRDYFITVAALAVALPIAGVLAGLAGALVNAVPIPIVPHFVANVIGLYPSFVMAYMLGQLLFVHGHALDWGDASQYSEPVLPGAVPRAPAGVVRNAPPPALPADADAPTSPRAVPLLDLGDASAGPALPASGLELARALPVAAVAAAPAVLQAMAPGPPEPAPVEAPAERPQPPPALDRTLPPAPATPAARLHHAIAARDFTQAMPMFLADREVLAAHLAPAESFTLAAALAHARHFRAAIDLLKRTAFSHDEVAPRSLFLLARLYSDTRNDFDAAERTFRTLLQKYPDSPEARGARAHLHKLGYDGSRV